MALIAPERRYNSGCDLVKLGGHLGGLTTATYMVTELVCRLGIGLCKQRPISLLQIYHRYPGVSFSTEAFGVWSHRYRPAAPPL